MPRYCMKHGNDASIYDDDDDDDDDNDDAFDN